MIAPSSTVVSMTRIDLISCFSNVRTICLVSAGGMLLLGRHLNHVALSLAEPFQTLLYGVYFVLPHLELFDARDLIIHNWSLIPWGIVGLAALYAAAYTVFFLWLAWLIFRRRALN